MKCQCCQKNEATMHVNDVDEWKTVDIVHICFECAGYLLPQLFGGKGPLASANELLVEARRLFSKDATVEGYDSIDESALDVISSAGEELLPKLACDECGMTFKDFQKTGRLGCPSCYESFDAMLAPALERIHGIGNAEHKGRKPGEARVSRKMAAIRRTQDLQRDLENAVKVENYERAAEIRDELNQLESEINAKSEA